MRRRDNYITIYNNLVTEEDEFHLTIEELYLYGLLRKKETLEGFSETSISFLGQTSEVLFASDTQRINKKIKELLLNLKSKGVINITDTDGTVLDVFKPSDFLKVTFILIEGGFAQIPIVNFNRCTTMSDFYIYCAVARWKNSGKGYFNSSYGRWAKILQLTQRHAIDLVNKAVENKIVYKNIGDYLDNESGGQKQQRLNQYSTNPFLKNEKSVQTKIQESNVANEEFHSNRINSEIEIIQLHQVALVFKTYKDDRMKDIYPSVEDYVYYLSLLKKLEGKQPSKTEKQFIEIAEKRIDRLQNNKKFHVDFDKAKIRVKAMSAGKDHMVGKAELYKSIDEMIENTIMEELIGV